MSAQEAKSDRQYYESIFWVELDKVKPNPFQPRREFDEAKLKELADSIRQYGLLQPLVVTRKETERPDIGITVEYELIAGERRLRASRLAGLTLLPVIIRAGEQTDKMKLELAIIENLHREDLNAVDRALAFKQLVDTYGYKHTEIGKKLGKSREYVSNTIRMLMLPKDMLDSLSKGDITEGLTRPLMMLTDRPEEQRTLYKEMLLKRLTVREAEGIARRIAEDRARKKPLPPDMLELERTLTETLGTRVTIQPKDQGGKVTIDFYDSNDIRSILDRLQHNLGIPHVTLAEASGIESAPEEASLYTNDMPKNEEEESELYSVRNFSI